MAEVICNDGTKDVDNGEVAPCLNHGGVDKHIIKGLTNGQRWAFVIGGTLLAYYILAKAGAFQTIKNSKL